MLADQQTCINKRRKFDIKKNAERRPWLKDSTEKVERAWAGLIKNKANLDEFGKGHPDTVYLEARKTVGFKHSFDLCDQLVVVPNRATNAMKRHTSPGCDS